MFGSMLRNIAPQIRQAVQQQPQQQALMPMQGGGGFFGGAIGGIAPQIAQGMPRQQQEYPTTPSITTLPPPQPGGGMRIGYDIINSPAVPGQQPRGFAALGPAIGSALGGMGAGFGGMPAPMQNPFLGGQPQGMSLPPPIPSAPQGPYAGIPPEMLSKFFPTQFDKPTVLPTGTAYKPQNFGDFGFDKQMVDYLNNQRKMSATDAGIDYVYDPATQTFKGVTMGGPVSKTLDQMRQAAAGYKPSMGGGMGQPFSPQVQVPPDMEKRLAMERANMPYTPPSQIPIGMSPPGTPQRPVSPFLQRVAQSMQRKQQQTQQPAQGIGTGIASLLGRFGGF